MSSSVILLLCIHLIISVRFEQTVFIFFIFYFFSFYSLVFLSGFRLTRRITLNACEEERTYERINNHLTSSYSDFFFYFFHLFVSRSLLFRLKTIFFFIHLILRMLKMSCSLYYSKISFFFFLHLIISGDIIKIKILRTQKKSQNKENKNDFNSKYFTLILTLKC